MKTQHWKLAGLVIVAAVLFSLAAYADRDNTLPLPEAVKAAVHKLYPGVKVSEAKLDEEGFAVYEILLDKAGRQIGLTLAPDGTVMEVEGDLSVDALPQAVQTALARTADGAKVKQVQEETMYWVVTIKKLDVPQLAYEAAITKDGEDLEIEFAADGTITQTKSAEKETDQEADEDEDSHENEDR